MTRNATLFREVGTALYGEHWHASLARGLGVSSRTVRRWAAGSFLVPEGAWQDIAAICKVKGKSLIEIASKLKSPPLA